MEPSISQNSISPSSAASYSFSPIAYHNNNTNNNAAIDTSNSLNQNIAYLNQQGHNNANNSFVSINNNVLGGLNNQQQQQAQFSFVYDAYSGVDLVNTSDLLLNDEDERNACNLAIETDFGALESSFFDNSGGNVSLPIDLESMLISATLSDDHSGHNILINSNNCGSVGRVALNQRNYGRAHQEDPSEDQNVNNNINPMFLFSKTNTNTNNNVPSPTRSHINEVCYNYVFLLNRDLNLFLINLHLCL